MSWKIYHKMALLFCLSLVVTSSFVITIAVGTWLQTSCYLHWRSKHEKVFLSYTVSTLALTAVNNQTIFFCTRNSNMENAWKNDFLNDFLRVCSYPRAVNVGARTVHMKNETDNSFDIRLWKMFTELHIN